MNSFSNLFTYTQNPHRDPFGPQPITNFHRQILHNMPPNHQYTNGYYHQQVLSHNAVDSDPRRDSSDSSSLGSSSPHVEYSSSPKSQFKNHNHHHHSIQELIRHFGKKVHNWRYSDGYRRNSCSVSEDRNVPKSEEADFRGRSKSLDGTLKRPHFRPLTDCESTYRIYESILKEGAHIRQKSLDPERRRQSLGTIPHRASDAFLDPHHAAILFRDSRGVS
ncbi:hypothetical protein HHI36_006015 [Cryptolaemus montrouzieri]|uniref:Uncharacterized protein n=1 Tax=Cryptolaemus montrouzieri TaxID=559131 RepID=A0ABD2NW34_9CUCU